MLLDSLNVLTMQFDPAQAEIAFTLPVDGPPESYELRGRLMGPRCAHTETIEIAYYLKPLPAEADTVRARIIVPEASFWEPATPFLYQGPVELWQGDRRLEATSVTHGLRHLVLRRQGLYLNGKRLAVRGVRGQELTPALAEELRQRGCNTLLLEATTEADATWEQANALGFLVLGQMDGENDAVLWHAEASLNRHPSLLGWVLPQRLIKRPQHWHNAMSLLHARHQPLIGIHVEELPLDVLPGHVSFLLCEPQHWDGLAALQTPRIVLSRTQDSAPETVDATVLGHIFKRMPDPVP